MPTVRLRLHGDLAIFVPPPRRAPEVTASFAERTSLKDTIEAVGIPHPEIGEVTVEGEPVSLDASIPDGAVVDIFPVPPSRFEQAPRFALDGHLGRLAATLRMLGFDVWWRPDVDDADLARISHDEDRVLLTRDVGLLKRSIVRTGAFVRSTRSRDQAREVVTRFGLREHFRPFTRCIRCNGLLSPATVEQVAPLIPPRVLERHQRFNRCEACGGIYWAGTHHERLEKVIEDLLTFEQPPATGE